MMHVWEFRDALAGVISVDGLNVVPRAVDGMAELPAAVIGMPKWEPGPTGCWGSFEIPVAVLVARPGISDEDTVDELDRMWPQVLEQIQDAIDVDQSLGGVCAAVEIVRAEFGLFVLQGQQWPAQLIFLTVTG